VAVKAIWTGRTVGLGIATDEAESDWTYWSPGGLGYVTEVDTETGIAYERRAGEHLHVDELSPWRRK